MFWNKARIPTRDEQHCVKKLETLYEKLRNFQKSERKMTDNMRENVGEFFDIAHQSAMTLIRIIEDRKFLDNQRKKSRPGCMF